MDAVDSQDFGTVPELLWSRSFSGSSPRVFLTSSSRILFQFGSCWASPPAKPEQLICLDRDGGEELWRRGDLFALDVLPGDRWLADAHGRSSLQVREATGEEVVRLPKGPRIADAVRHGDRLALATMDGRVIVTDLALTPSVEFAWPRKGSARLGCLIGQRFHWVEENEIWCCDFAGRAERLAEIPLGALERAMSDYEVESGLPAKQGWSITFPRLGEKSETRSFTVGDRPMWYEWSLTHDAETEVTFLSTLTLPHLLLCFDKEFRMRWCRYIHWGCCGGPGYRLPSGQWVASTGCGGVLTWFDDAGNILFQSKPFEGAGLAIAFDTRLKVLSSGQSLVMGAPGVMAYERGELVWRLNVDVHDYAVCERDELLVVCRWEPSRNVGWEGSRTVGSRVILKAHRLPTQSHA